MECSNCGHELTNVFAARSVELDRPSGDKWVETTVFHSGCSCPNCHEDLSNEEMEELGIPAGYR